MDTPSIRITEALSDEARALANKPRVPFFVVDGATADRLDKTALVPAQKTEEEIFEEIKKIVGFSQDKWTPEIMRAKQQFGGFLRLQTTARMLLVNNFSNLDQIELAMQKLQKMADDPTIDAKVRVQALQCVAVAAKVGGDLGSQILDLVKDASDKDNSAQSQTAMPMNRPPPLQVNITNNVPQPPQTSSAKNGSVIDVTPSTNDR
jgi:hypothetical protein